jgi:hypothetical protein
MRIEPQHLASIILKDHGLCVLAGYTSSIAALAAAASALSALSALSNGPSDDMKKYDPLTANEKSRATHRVDVRHRRRVGTKSGWLVRPLV